MRSPELPLILLGLVLCQAPRGPAAPVPEGGGTALAKMYPRGNHWAVGHLMGKKSTGEPLSEGDSWKQQPRGDIWWEEATRSLLGLLEAKGSRSHQPPQLEPLGNHQPPWHTEESSTFKDVLKGKNETPSGMDRDNDNFKGAKQNP